MNSASTEIITNTSDRLPPQERLIDPAIVSVADTSVHQPVPSSVCLPSNTSISTVTNMEINSPLKSLIEMKKQLDVMKGEYHKKVRMKKRCGYQAKRRKQKKRQKKAALLLDNGQEKVNRLTETISASTTPAIKEASIPKSKPAQQDNSLEERRQKLLLENEMLSREND